MNTKEIVILDKLEELKDYAKQTENTYLTSRINRIIEEVKTDEIATWDSIFKDWQFYKFDCIKRELNYDSLETYLINNYNVPFKKQ